MIYFLMPYFRSGGPENAHQICSLMNKIAGTEKARIIYFRDKLPETPTNIYPEIDDVGVGYVSEIRDLPENVIVLPEIYIVHNILCELHIQKCRVVVWWLSYVNAVDNDSFRWNIHRPNTHHYFHSYYEYAMVRPRLSPSTPFGFLTDFISDEFLQNNPDDYIFGKEKIVCFNGHKDNTSFLICRQHNIPHIVIKNSTREDVKKTLARCMVYVDLGFHPGKDHMPREAAMYGCVVVTNKSGSAAYWEDVPIKEKIVFDEDLPILIQKIFEDYETYYKNQSVYRTQIKNEKNIAMIHAHRFLELQQPPIHTHTYHDPSDTTTI